MNETVKENSALELYETAYTLHYVDGNIPEACRMYKAIIDDFPNSNECGYAVIQLQKIQANDVADAVRSPTNRFGVFQIVMMTLCILVCLVLSVAAFLFVTKSKSDLEALSLVSQAISMLYAGNDADALEILSKAKTVSNGTMSAPYLLTANIYLNMQQFSRARAEYEAYQKASGKSDISFKKMVSVKSDRFDRKIQAVRIDSTPAAEVPAVQPVAQEQQAPVAAVRQPPPEKEKPSLPSPLKPKPKPEKSKPARSSKSSAKSSANPAPDTSFF